jgi:WD40 repeat protein
MASVVYSLRMRGIALLSFLMVLTFTSALIVAQSVKSFPSADAMLRDAKHKEPKSGVQIGPGNSITIQSGVGTPTTINVLAFAKSGTLLAAGKDFGRAVVWDLVNRKFLCAVDTGQGIVLAVAISPDGQALATAGQGDQFKLKLWRLPDGKLLKTYDSFYGYIHSLAFGPDGSWLALSENSGTTQILDVTNGRRLLELKDTHSPVQSPDGTVLMTVDKTEFTFWNTSDWTKQRTLPRVPPNAIPLALNPKTDTFVATSSERFDSFDQARASCFRIFRRNRCQSSMAPQGDSRPSMQAILTFYSVTATTGCGRGIVALVRHTSRT